MAIEHKFNLSTTEPFNNVGVIKVRQSDDQTQLFQPKILKNNKTLDLTGYKAFFMLRTETTTGIIEQEAKIIDAKNGRVDYTLNKYDWQKGGKNTAYFSFRKLNTDNSWKEQFTTRDFEYTVTNSAYSKGITDSNYVWTFEDLLRLLNEFKDSATFNFDEWFKSIEDVLETVDPGGTLLNEVIKARKPEGEKAYLNLSERLDNRDKFDSSLDVPNAMNRLALVDAYDTIDAIHPKVLKFSTPWNGFYWWQAFTPYPKGNQALENPHIMASNNMTTWVEPEGFKNPLDKQPSNDPTRQYNSDTHLVFREDLNRLECWWRFVDEDEDRVIIWRRTTTDGVNWTEKEVMIDWKKSTKDCVCPVVVFEDNLYKCWFVNDGYKMWYMTSANGKNWSNATEVLIPYQSKTMKNWHHDIIHTDTGYEMVIASFENGTNRNEMSLYYSKSEDGLSGWSTAKKIMSPSTGRLGWDNRGLYRSSLLYDDGTYYLFYSGININGNRGIGISYGSDPRYLKGLESAEAYILNNMKAFNMVFGAYLRNHALRLVTPNAKGNWEGVLNNHSDKDMKLSKTGVTSSAGDLKNLLVNAIKAYEGIVFQGRSAWLKPEELKLDNGSNTAYLKVVGNGDIEIQRASSGPGTLVAQAIRLVDNGTPTNVPEGTIRWASSRKKYMYFNGTEWKNIGE